MYNLKNIKSTKCGYSPEQTEEQALNPETGKHLQKIYGFHRLIKVEENKDRLERFDSKTDNKRKKRLRDPLETADKLSVLAKRLQKKKTLLEDYIKAQQKITSSLIEAKILQYVNEQNLTITLIFIGLKKMVEE